MFQTIIIYKILHTYKRKNIIDTYKCWLYKTNDVLSVYILLLIGVLLGET